MNNWDINDIFLSLDLKNNFNKNIKVKKIVIDSKKVKKGDLFIAIKGKKFNIKRKRMAGGFQMGRPFKWWP